jgi:PD-(D/E)XK nuclease superfamily protein
VPNLKSQQPNPACVRCGSKSTIKKGRRKNRFRLLQVFQCGECLYKFTADAGKNKTYPPSVILEAISTYNLGRSVSDTQRAIRQRLHMDIPEGTIRAWIRAYKSVTTYARLRAEGKTLFDPTAMIRSFILRHKQVYRFQLHRAKLELLLKIARHSHLAPAKNYLEAVGENFPHGMFQTTEHRSSKFPTRLWPPIVRKENYATRLAALVLPTAAANKKRHETLQRFMLLNDSATVAVEIPVYLTAEDIAYYRGRGFKLDFDNSLVTGHIDFLQIRDGYLQILDYKPDARKEKHAHVQLTIYALALARRTNLPLKNLKCAWFDEKDYFEFFPLKGVYEPKTRPHIHGPQPQASYLAAHGKSAAL